MSDNLWKLHMFAHVPGQRLHKEETTNVKERNSL